MQPNIICGYMLLSTTHEIWLAAMQTYSEVGNDAQVSVLVKKAHKRKQGERNLSDYYAELLAICQNCAPNAANTRLNLISSGSLTS